MAKRKSKTKSLADRWDVVGRLEKALEALQDPLDLTVEYVRAENREGELAIFTKMIYRRKLTGEPCADLAKGML